MVRMFAMADRNPGDCPESVATGKKSDLLIWQRVICGLKLRMVSADVWIKMRMFGYD